MQTPMRELTPPSAAERAPSAIVYAERFAEPS